MLIIVMTPANPDAMVHAVRQGMRGLRLAWHTVAGAIGHDG